MMPLVQAEISEGPTWLEAREELAFVDIEGKAVHVWSPRDGSSWKLDVPGRPGTLTPTCQPHLLLIAIEQAIFWLDLDRREVNLSCTPPPPPPPHPPGVHMWGDQKTRFAQQRPQTGIFKRKMEID